MFGAEINHGSEGRNPFVVLIGSDQGQLWQLYWHTTPAELRKLADDLEAAMPPARCSHCGHERHEEPRDPHQASNGRGLCGVQP